LSGPAQIQSWPVGRPLPYTRNARICPPAAVEKVARSIEEFGFRVPILVDSGDVIIAGHTRLAAAKQLGLAEVPVIVCADLTDDQVRALRIADNRLSEETSWDPAVLAGELAELRELGVDLGVSGFEPDQLAALLAAPVIPGLADPDEIPEPPAEPICAAGELWALGEHRLLCADCTRPEAVELLMGSERAPLMATDPPYLVDYDGGNHPQSWGQDAHGKALKASGVRSALARDAAPDHEEATKHWDTYVDHDTSVTFYAGFLRAALAGALAERPAIYQWFGMMRMEIVCAAWALNDVKLHQVVLWTKTRPVLGRLWYMWDYEPCAVGWPEGRQPPKRRHPPASARATWPLGGGMEGEAERPEHPTVKPVELFRRPTEYHTVPGEVVYEPFCGSGTAIIAAEMTGRRCYAIEISAPYCDVAIERWQRFTGLQARRIS